MEEWKDIPGHEGYQASSLGAVRSLDRKHKGKILKNMGPSKDGYYRNSLSVSGIVTSHLTHRLICKAFHATVVDKLTVDHINRNKLDNNITNLRWADRYEQAENQGHEMGITNERYISITPLRYYMVRIQNNKVKACKNFKTLDEAIAYRDTLTQI